MGVRRRLRRKYRAWRRYGMSDRSKDLLLLAVIWCVVGFFATRGDPDPNYKVPLEYIGEPARIAVWYGGALAAVISVLRGPGRDSWGFALLTIAPAMRAISYWVAWILGVIGIDGAEPLWPDAILWTAVSLVVYRFARRPELPPRSDGTYYSHRPPRRPGAGRGKGEHA